MKNNNKTNYFSYMTLNVEKTGNVEQFEEMEDTKSYIQGAMGHSSELVAEPLITKGYFCIALFLFIP